MVNLKVKIYDSNGNERLSAVLNSKENVDAEKVEMALVKFLKECGFDPKLKGFGCLVKAAMKYYDDTDILYCNNKVLLASICNKKEMTEAALERNIRTLIDKAWNEDCKRVFCEKTGYAPECFANKPGVDLLIKIVHIYVATLDLDSLQD